MKDTRVVDTVNDCAYKLSFLSFCFYGNPKITPEALSQSATTGLSLILDDISDRLFEAGSNIELEAK